ncbi:Histidine kinase [Flavobacterium sp. 9AF]|uniref:sensor histidine kinase n=1 Tax=Flavobacterium sp. 9AF TaxID=2653142 RepID=UPI0012F0B866|nr:histidine kinase [Flavobacterium sp. 9AF]VXB73940.1 Histidine kinase [Flavobacterium sp. 9AF]
MNKKKLAILTNIFFSFTLLLIPIIGSPDVNEGILKLINIPPFQRNILSSSLLIPIFFLNHYLFIPKIYKTNKWYLYYLTILVCFLIYWYLPEFILPTEKSFTRNLNADLRFIDNPKIFDFQKFFPFLLTLSVSYFIKQNERISEIQIQKRNAEISQLKSQINPHFLFNTLNNIYALTLFDIKNAQEGILKLSNIFRYTVSESNNDFVPLEDEINHIKDYIDLQKLRSTQETIHFKFIGNFKNNRISPLIFISFIENAFKYGINPDRKSKIEGFILINENLITLDIKNDIVNQIDERLKTSIGTKNTILRLQLMYPKKHTLTINNDNMTYHINLKIELE